MEKCATLETEEIPAVRAKIADVINKRGSLEEKFSRRRQESEEL